MKEVYLDNAAATLIDPRAARAVQVIMREPGNPSAFNVAGRRAATVLAEARGGLARFLNARADEVVLCASGSEANTLAITGVMRAVPGRMDRVVTTAIEHPSVLEPVRALQRRGCTAAILTVGPDGTVPADVVTQALNRRTALVSIAYANNEVGTIQPIKAIAKAIRGWRKTHGTMYPYLHVDACQATAWLPMDVQALGVDLLTLNGAKAYGPRGSAALFVRRGTELAPQVLGGDQEQGRRAGTEDVPAAAGLAAALGSIKATDAGRTAHLRDRLLAGILATVPDTRLNGPQGAGRLANNTNVSFRGVDSEALLLELDRRGIRASAGSACTAQHTGPSHVLVALSTPEEYIGGAIRFSLSRHTTPADIARVVKVLPAAVASVRRRNLK